MFKNVSKLICSSNFTRPNNYILHHQNQVTNPVSQFFDFNRDKSNYTPFESSMLALAFSQQSQQLSTLLLEAQGNQFSKFRVEAKEQLDQSKNMSEFFINNCYSMFKQVNFNVPVKGYTSFVLSSVLHNKTDLEYMKTYIFPRILEKIDYLDREGFEDLLDSLNQINYNDQKFIQTIIDKFQQRQVDFQECTFYAWNLDQYEQATRQQSQGIYAQFFQDLKSNKIFANQRHQYRQFQSVLKNRFINRLLFRESRIQFEFSNYQRYNVQQLVEQVQRKLLG